MENAMTEKYITFADELANLMEKYDVRFVVDDNIDGVDIWMLQNEWEPVEVPFEWNDGMITSDTVRNLKTAK
tara:strand:+ start:301 stop:516 length:216 start_codon:yes stop_codon:yes gene_type:complete